MNAIQQLLTDHIDIWTAAENEKKSVRGRALSSATSVYGIKKLRELILELGVRGKLVPQDPTDEPADELFIRLHAEKAQLITEGKAKLGKPYPEISSNEKLFDLPAGWKWIRLGDFVLSIISGGTPSKNNPEFWDGDVPWASVKDLNGKKFLESTEDYITQAGLKAGSKLANKGDLLVCTRMGLGKIAIAAMDVAINQDLKALKLSTLINIDYFINFYSTLKIVGSGMTVAGIKQDELLGYCIPTPPLAEQQRIVTKVDELMALCDQLEAHHSNTSDAHEQLVGQLLLTLAQSQNTADFNTVWQSIATHFDTLFITETSIDTLQQTLLQLAVMGKLVAQDPSDEPATELLKRIEAVKTKLLVEGRIKKEKPPAVINALEKQFNLPSGWEWVRLQSVIDVRDGTHDSPKSAEGCDTYPLVTSKDFVDGKINFESAKRISKMDHVEIAKRSFVEKFDILFSMIGGNIGNQVMVLEDRPFSIKNVALFKYYDKNLTCPFFVKIFTEYMSLKLQSSAVGGAQPFVALGALRNIVLALPPLAEQRRIVAKVDELKEFCELLRVRLAEAKQQQKKLADVFVRHALT